MPLGASSRVTCLVAREFFGRPPTRLPAFFEEARALSRQVEDLSVLGDLSLRISSESPDSSPVVKIVQTQNHFTKLFPGVTICEGDAEK